MFISLTGTGDQCQPQFRYASFDLDFKLTPDADYNAFQCASVYVSHPAQTEFNSNVLQIPGGNLQNFHPGRTGQTPNTCNKYDEHVLVVSTLISGSDSDNDESESENIPVDRTDAESESEIGFTDAFKYVSGSVLMVVLGTKWF